MLAMLWDGLEATSVWVELVRERVAELEKQCEGGYATPMGALMVSRQSISRSQLAEWGASVRS
jgi:hypothetical protein